MNASKQRVGLEADTQNVIEFYLEGLNSPVSLGVYLRLKYMFEDPALALELANMEIAVEDYDDWLRFERDYDAICLLSKADFLPTGVDREEKAYEKFIAAEEKCRITNQRFRSMWKNPCVGSAVNRVLSYSSLKISQILGTMPPISDVEFKFGPGSTTSCGGVHTSSYNKLIANLDFTWECLPLLTVVKSSDAWMKIHGGPNPTFNVVKGSKLMFVEKNAKTMRSICVEPTVNSWLQLGFGSAIRKKLQKVGLLRPDAQEIHRLLAQASSVTGELATVDLSAASDSIAYCFVLDQLGCTDWMLCLESCRSPGYIYKGSYNAFEKWSSMGNGYTFELETLLFYALAWGCCYELNISDEGLSVYGDDIIIPVGAVDLLNEMLDFCGFALNPSKSFVTGPFRESCGGHFFSNCEVTPLYIKKEIQNGHESVILANRIREHSQRNYSFGCSSVYYTSWRCAVQSARRRLGFVPRGPKGLGDGHVHVNWDEARPCSRYEKNYQRREYRYTTFACIAQRRPGRNVDGIYADMLYRAESKGIDTTVETESIRRERTKRPVLEYMYSLRSDKVVVRRQTHRWTTEWPDMGPWC